MTFCECACGANLTLMKRRGELRRHARHASAACRLRVHRARVREAEKAFHTRARACEQRIRQARTAAFSCAVNQAGTYTRSASARPLAVQTLRVFTAISENFNDRRTDAVELLPTPPRDNSLSSNELDELGELRRENQWLKDELERLREAARIDLQNAQAQNVALGRQLTAAKNELVRQHEEEPEHDEIKTLLLHWKHVMGKTGRVDIGPGGKRYRTVKAAVKRWGFDRCRNAIDGLALRQHVGPRGRSELPYPGSQLLNDVEYAFGTDKGLDETRLEKCLAAFDASVRPTLAPVSEWQPEPSPPKPLQAVPVAALSRPMRMIGPDPITRVLACAHQGLAGGAGPGQVRCGADADTWQCLCPAHEDSDPSLSIRRLPDGKVLLHCFAGCSTEDVLAAWGLEWNDLWDGFERDRECADALYRRDVTRRPGQVGYEPPAPHLVRDLERVLDSWKAAA